MKKRRIFLGVLELGGMMERLNNAFHEMGMESDFYCVENDFFFGEKNDKPILKKYRVHTSRKKNAAREWEKTLWSVFQMWDILHAFFYVLLRYDLFIYIYGRGMFFYNRYLRKVEELEFFILKIFRKKMVMWLCGSDSRAPYCNGAFCGEYSVAKLYSMTLEKAKRVRMLEKYMVLIDNPASSHFHTKPYVIFDCIEIPIDEEEMVQNSKRANDKITILHAPSNQKIKGTTRIRNIIKEIKEEGYDFEYIEVSGVPHEVVREKMAKADIVIDQLYCDTPKAIFATEAALNGVPVVIGGYYADVYKEVLPSPIAPTVFCNPEELKEKLIYLIGHKEERDRIGKAEREYVENHCFARNVANNFMKIFDDVYPREWIMNPADNNYIWGIGLEKKVIADEIVKLIDCYGTEALCLDKNGILYKRYLQLYNECKKNSEGEVEV